MTPRRVARGSYFEELCRGRVFADAPAVTVTADDELADGGQSAHLRVVVSVDGETAGADRPVLDWRSVGVLA